MNAPVELRVDAVFKRRRVPLSCRTPRNLQSQARCKSGAGSGDRMEWSGHQGSSGCSLRCGFGDGGYVDSLELDA